MGAGQNDFIVFDYSGRWSTARFRYQLPNLIGANYKVNTERFIAIKKEAVLKGYYLYKNEKYHNDFGNYELYHYEKNKSIQSFLAFSPDECEVRFFVFQYLFTESRQEDIEFLVPAEIRSRIQATPTIDWNVWTLYTMTKFIPTFWQTDTREGDAK